MYPHLLRGVAVVRPNQVWRTDITYIRLERGFAYLVAIIDWYSRRVLSWRIKQPHQALGNKTPGEVYQSASGGGAMIVDKYGAKEGLPVALRSSVIAFKKRPH